MEIGESYLALRDMDKSLEYINKGGDMIRSLYGEDHSLMQRYYQYMLIYESVNQKDMVLFCQKDKELSQVTNGEKSVFTLDALLMEISMQSDQDNTASVLSAHE